MISTEIPRSMTIYYIPETDCLSNDNHTIFGGKTIISYKSLAFFILLIKSIVSLLEMTHYIEIYIAITITKTHHTRRCVRW